MWRTIWNCPALVLAVFILLLEKYEAWRRSRLIGKARALNILTEDVP